MTGSRILVVEDDKSLSDILKYNLEQAGFEVICVADGLEAIDVAGRKHPKLIILDLMLPSIDGVEVCRRLRTEHATRDTLIIMLTAKAEETDQIVGFAVGADDYVTKPFSTRVLVERVKALLRRKSNQTNEDTVSCCGVVVDRRRHVATAGDRDLELTPNEFGLLNALVRQPGRAFSRHDLIDEALGSHTIVLERTIDVHIRSLRQKLGDFGELVETVRGIGYRFRAE